MTWNEVLIGTALISGIGFFIMASSYIFIVLVEWSTTPNDDDDEDENGEFRSL